MQGLKEIFKRVKQLVLKPKEAWETIATEEATISGLFKEYLLILAAVPALAYFLGWWIFGMPIPLSGGRVTLAFFPALLNAFIWYALMVAGIWAFSKVISYLASRFESEKDDLKGMKVAVYAYSPFLAAGVLYIYPSLGILVTLAGLYSLYILYLGLPIVMGSPKEKALPYTIVVIISMILIYFIISIISTPLMRAFAPDLYTF